MKTCPNQIRRLPKSRVCTRCLKRRKITLFRVSGRHLIGWCKSCEKDYQRSNYQENKERIAKRHADWRRKNPEKHNEYSRAYRARTPSYAIRQNLLRRRKYAKNKDKILKRNKEFYQKTKRTFFAKNALRKAQRIQATPIWSDRKAIKDFYSKCPDGHHVDHIIPLQNKNVCGLHVLFNLQYLPASENLKKGNRFSQIRI